MLLLCEAYRGKYKEVKKRCRRDKNNYILQKTVEAEKVGSRGDSKTLFRIVKELVGNTGRPALPIKKKMVKRQKHMKRKLDNGRSTSRRC